MAISREDLNDWVIWEENGLLRASKTEMVYLNTDGIGGILSMPTTMDQAPRENPSQDRPS